MATPAEGLGSGVLALFRRYGTHNLNNQSSSGVALELFEMLVADALRQVHLSVGVVNSHDRLKRKRLGRSLARNVRACGSICFDECTRIVGAPIHHPAPERYLLVKELAQTYLDWAKANQAAIFKARGCLERPIRELLQCVIDWMCACHRVLGVRTAPLVRQLAHQEYVSRWGVVPISQGGAAA